MIDPYSLLSNFAIMFTSEWTIFTISIRIMRNFVTKIEVQAPISTIQMAIAFDCGRNLMKSNEIKYNRRNDR